MNNQFSTLAGTLRVGKGPFTLGYMVYRELHLVKCIKPCDIWAPDVSFAPSSLVSFGSPDCQQQALNLTCHNVTHDGVLHLLEHQKHLLYDKLLKAGA